MTHICFESHKLVIILQIKRKLGPHAYKAQAPVIVFANLALVSRLLSPRSANNTFCPKPACSHLVTLISSVSLGFMSINLGGGQQIKRQTYVLVPGHKYIHFNFLPRLKPAFFKSCRLQPSIHLLEDEIVAPRHQFCSPSRSVCFLLGILKSPSTVFFFQHKKNSFQRI